MNLPPLLPSDRRLMQLLADSGVSLTEEEWRAFKAEVRHRAATGPQPAVIAGIDPVTISLISLISTVISVGLTIVASFFKPRGGARAAQLETRQQDPESVTNIRRYTPRYGFDALQDPAGIGTTIPLVYALREPRNGVTVGGVRVSLPLLWSQMQSTGGGQLLRAIYMISEGPIDAVDPKNFALGNNSISSYDLPSESANLLGSRLTIYFRGSGGRLRSADRILGRAPESDAGNSEAQGGPDVFSIRRDGAWYPDFCSSYKPSTQTTFGLYTLIGNNLAFRVNPNIRPTVNSQLIPKGKDGDAIVKCEPDEVAEAARSKYRTLFSSRSGIVRGNVNAVGATVVYRLDSTSDALTEFTSEFQQAQSLWSLRLDVTTNPFPPSTGVTDGMLESFVKLSSLVTDNVNKLLKATITFSPPDASQALKNVNDGTYTVKYTVNFVEAGVNKRVIQRDYTVYINKASKYTADLTPATSYTPPVLSGDLTAGYTLSTGAVSFSGSVQLIEVAFFTYTPVNETFNIQLKTKDPTVERAGDVASAVAGRQKTWDDAIVIGDLYKVGSALAVCTNRSPDNKLFESEADYVPVVRGGGQSIEATFTTIRPGVVNLTSLDLIQANGDINNPKFRSTATNNSHIFRVAIANFTTSRPCRIVEIGFRSSMGIRISGLCNFKDSLTYNEINGRACLNYNNTIVNKGDTLKTDIFQSGVLSTSEDRYSFFRISYREAGSTAEFTQLPQCFGFRCITQQSSYNSIRLNMGSVKRWEFRFEPLSGWEIRYNIAQGPLELIDNKLNTTRVVFGGVVTADFKGTSLSRTKNTFALNTVRRTTEIGIYYTDEDSYLDAWGKLAEAFVYEEAQSSAASGPEHEIVYVNEIVENVTTPTYADLAAIGLSIRSSLEFQQVSQLTAYVSRGIRCRRLLFNLSVGPTHLLPDIAFDLFTNKRYGRGDLIPDELINIEDFTTSARWCQDRGYFFDGAISTRQNLRQWLADVAATHLLIFGEANGKFFLKPAFSTTPVKIQADFSAGNIREGSFRFQYLDAEERRPIQVSVKYREERASSNPTNPGLFPVEREILIREASTPDTAPIQTIPMSEYATSRQHAIDAGKYVALASRLNNSGIRFDTTHEGILAALSPGDYIRVALDTSVYDEFNNGGVTFDGNLVSTKPLVDGTYSAIIWNGKNASPPQEGSLFVTNNGTRAVPTGIVFTIKKASSEVRVYQVTSIEPNAEGYFTIEAVHSPIRNTGILEMAAAFDDPGNWIIQE